MSLLDAVLSRISKRFARLEAQVAELERRLNNLIREAVVDEVNDDGTVVVTAAGLQSKPVPSITRAGNLRDWEPHTPNERVLLISPTGEAGKGLVLPGGYSDQFTQPHNKTDEARRSLGDTVITMTGSGYVIETQSMVIKCDDLTIEANVDIKGDRVTHNGKNIGDTHKHGGVVRGQDKTDPPI
ncbi:putative baseplate assembly protein V [Roseibium sp. TrichSKD4]|uniref:phage baseplate assembly protein V n=1 Tax=Roseibium sp. TrichSKD4 TaxID=744980 RepID=UPI0001E56CD5|nr:phage baseplate assembly protein V [Roseibium sp. TrichSKD4]EFO32128.1 putative baseplate assembly protein V [Roseibium sp. TrichSKD4]